MSWAMSVMHVLFVVYKYDFSREGIYQENNKKCVCGFGLYIWIALMK